MPSKVAILIPSTTRQRAWKNIKETDLYKVQLKSFLLTYCPQHTYTYYIGIDDDDPLYSQDAEKKELLRFISIMKNVSLQFISLKGIAKGHLTSMWNLLFHRAYHDGNEYFYQCGDDIQFINKGWVSKSIELLQLYHGYGVTGPHDRMQHRVHTQSFVSRRHYEIFGVYFPPQIKNWFCDDWITKVYANLLLFPLRDKWCMNVGGAPRYTSPIENNTLEKEEQLCDKLIFAGKIKLKEVVGKITFPVHIMRSFQAQMIAGLKKNEVKYGEMVTKTYNKVLNQVRNKNVIIGGD